MCIPSCAGWGPQKPPCTGVHVRELAERDGLGVQGCLLIMGKGHLGAGPAEAELCLEWEVQSCCLRSLLPS